MEPVGDDRDLIAQLEHASEGGAVAAPPKPEPMAAPVVTPEPAEGQGKWDADQGRFLRIGEVSLAELEAAFMSAEGPVETAGVREAKPAPAPVAVAVEQDEEKKGGIGGNTIRVNVTVLESLMTMCPSWC